MFLLISSNFQNSTFEIITITVTEIVLIQMFFFTIDSKQKNKNENTEYHGTFIQVYSKPRSSIFFFAWVMEFSIISSCLGIVKVFPIILPFNLVDVQRLHEKGKSFYTFRMGVAIYGWLFVYELSGCGIDSRCSNINVSYCVCFEQTAH